jgi:hypothetical protein
MRPLLRAVTVAMTLTMSYDMIAVTAATAGDDKSDTSTEKSANTNTTGRLEALPYRDLSRRQRNPAAPTRSAAPTTGPPEDSHGAEPAVTTKAKPYDVNGDGKADAVVGAVSEDLGYDQNAGMLHVLYGRSTGITSYGDKAIHQDTYGVPGSPEDDDMFAWANTSGDFNADGFADVAVSVAGEDIGSAAESGLVQVFYGSTDGLRTTTVTGLEIPREYLTLGVGLAAGDFNGDGRDDLAAGGPGDDFGIGSVFVYHGTATGLSTMYQEFKQGGNVPGVPRGGDYFGETLAAGDINGDGRDDLAIASSGDWEDLGWPTGSVTVLYGSATGLNGNHDGQRLSKETPEVPGDGGWFDSEAEDAPDSFGYHLTLADFSGDGKADLAVGAPGSPVTYNGIRRPDAGTVTVLYSNGTQIGTDNAIEITEATPGIPGIPSDYDYLGVTVAGGDPNGDGKRELAMYSLGDHYVTVIPGSPAGLNTGSAKGWTQDTYGIPGIDEPEDLWGISLLFENIKGAGRDSLLVGATGENSGRGAFTVIHSTSTGLTGTGAQAFSQNTYGVEGTAENGDEFGAIY